MSEINDTHEGDAPKEGNGEIGAPLPNEIVDGAAGTDPTTTAPDSVGSSEDTGSGTDAAATSEADTKGHRSIMLHRHLIRTALAVFKDACTKALKAEATIDNDTSETEAKIREADALIEMLKDQRDLLLEGTPMGDAMTRDMMKHPRTGQSLTVDSIGELLEAAGFTDWAGEIVSNWTLDERVQAADWLTAEHAAIEQQQHTGAPRPAFIPDNWLSDAAWSQPQRQLGELSATGDAFLQDLEKSRDARTGGGPPNEAADAVTNGAKKKRMQHRRRPKP